MEFKDRIKALRVEKGLTAVELAKKLDRSESAVRMWESGISKPDCNTLIELSILFRCSADYSLGLHFIRNCSQIFNVPP